VYGSYCRLTGANPEEAELPLEAYPSLGAFFVRRLRAGARPLDPAPRALLSPCDGTVQALDRIEGGTSLQAKGQTYGVAELLGAAPGEGLADGLEGAWTITIYLSPRDYHRVHAPVDGPVSLVRHVGGTLYPVNSIGLQHVPRLFAQNERVVTTQRVEGTGEVATIMVGAIGVGRISSSFEPRVLTNAGTAPAQTIGYGSHGPRLERGQELGVFHLGSTAIVTVPPGPDAHFEVEPGAVVRMGQAILRLGAV